MIAFEGLKVSLNSLVRKAHRGVIGMTIKVPEKLTGDNEACEPQGGSDLETVYQIEEIYGEEIGSVTFLLSGQFGIFKEPFVGPSLVFGETSMFGVNQGCTGRYIGPRIAWVLGIFNLCFNGTLTYFVIKGKNFKVEGDLPIGYISRMVFYYLVLGSTLIIQIRYLSRRHKMASVGRELSHLCQLSTWNGDISGCIGRMVLYLGVMLLHELIPAYQNDSKGWRILAILCTWPNFAPTVATEFLGQAMLLFQHEFKVLCKMVEDMAAKGNYKMEELRALNRRHASLFALSDVLAGFTGFDSLLIIETERLLILLTVVVQINKSINVPTEWGVVLFTIGSYLYRMERITHLCFRGYRVIREADRFVSTLDEFDPLDFENDEFFTEFQIFRKQARLRKLRFDCNGFLKLDIKLIFRMLKHLLTLIIILIQLTADLTIETTTPANTTLADKVTEYFLGFSEMQSNSSTKYSTNY